MPDGEDIPSKKVVEELEEKWPCTSRFVLIQGHQNGGGETDLDGAALVSPRTVSQQHGKAMNPFGADRNDKGGRRRSEEQSGAHEAGRCNAQRQ
ncbi:hypothetical protein KM043_008368 [Ampulex compressa]|nr:hypothetical protein KM043_008368 [Ampulex compressa]